MSRLFTIILVCAFMENYSIKSLVKVIGIDEEKCVNCHSCITSCPVKFCNNGSGKYVSLNSDMCIACGSCIEACTHEARYYIDDFPQFLTDLKAGIKMVAIVAPAIAANFPGKYLNINGWLKHIGVEAVFDVSFGAELTVKSYLNHLKANNPEVVIAQPCPAIVSYIELYRPELLKYLAPAHSPMTHTMKMIKEFYKQYADYKIAVVSPCNAKKREFQETGYGDYNLAIKSIDKYFKENKINLEYFPKVDFDNPPAERAVLFSTPGGLLQTAERWMPGIRNKTRKIEGKNIIYEYLNKLPKIINEHKAPLLIDCLNCDYGCNAGPLTLMQQESPDEIEYWVNRRNLEMQEIYKNQTDGNELLSKEKIESEINKYWYPSLYERNYVNLWENVKLNYPTEEQLKGIYQKMHKFTDKEIYNCSACGYGNCKDMATAIFNGLNRSENCHFYLLTETEVSHREAYQSERRLQTILDTMQDAFLQIDLTAIITHTNPAMKKLLKKNDLIGRRLFDFLDDDNKAILRKQMEIRAQNTESTYELTLTQSDGNQVFTLVSASPLYDDNKHRMGSFAMMSDISPIKKVQQELSKVNESLEERVRLRTVELSEMLEELRASTEIIEENSKKLEKLSIVAQKTDNAILIMDPMGNIEWFNDGFSKMYGYTFDEYLAKKGKNIIEISNYHYIKEAVKTCVFDKETIHYESYAEAPSGQRLWMHTTLTPILDENQHVSKLVAIDSDVSRLKEAEEEILQQKEEITSQAEQLEKSLFALKESEQKFFDIIDFMPDAVLVVDKDKKIIAWNKSIEEMTGVRAEYMLGKGDYEYSVPFYGERRPILIDLIFMTNEEILHSYSHVECQEHILIAENYVPNLKGREFYMLASASPLYNELGDVVGAIEVIRDITDRRKAEDLLKTTNELLQRQKDEITEKTLKMAEMVEELKITTEIIEDYNKELEKLSIVARETDNAVLIMDAEGNFLWINEGFTKLYGYSLEELMEVRGSNLLNEESSAQIKEAFKICLLEKRSVIFESMNISKNQEKIWAQTTLTPIFNDEGILSKLVAIDSDISELKQAEQEILQQKEEIEAQRDEIERQRDLATNQRDLLRKQKKDITDSIHYASRIQSALLPPNESLDTIFRDYFVFYQPRDIVSGDFYWLKRKENYVLFAAADSTGHGVPGAFMSLLGIAFLNEISIRIFNSGIDIKNLKASDILNDLRNQLKFALHQTQESATSRDGMDIALCVFNTETNVLHYAGAYNPLILIRNNKLNDIKADKMPIGIYINEKESFTNHEIQLQSNDCIYIFSDGFSDQFGGVNGRKFYSKNFKDLLRNNHQLPMKEQKENISHIIQSWMKNPIHESKIYEQVDDMLVIGIRI